MKIFDSIRRLIQDTDQKVRLKTHYTLSDLVFWISFCLLLIIHCIENTSLTYLDTPWFPAMYLLRNCLYLVMIAKIGFLSSFTTRELIITGVTLLLGCISFFTTDDFGLCEFFIIAIASKDITPRKLVSVFLKIKGIAVALTLALYATGILPTLHYLDDAVGSYNTYGFVHRNVLGANMAILCLAWFYLRYRDLDKWDLILWCALAAVTYKLAISRSSLITMLLIIAGVSLYKYFEPRLMKMKHTEKILLGTFLGLFAVSLICTILFDGDSSFWNRIDRIFTKRFRFSNQCLVDHGITLFGNDIPFLSSMDAQNADKRKLILDNSYMRAILFYGIIPGGVYLYGYYQAFKNAIAKKESALIICLFIFTVYGFSERYMLDVFYCFPAMIACQSFFYKSKPHKRIRRMKDAKNTNKTPLEHIFGFIEERLK